MKAMPLTRTYLTWKTSMKTLRSPRRRSSLARGLDRLVPALPNRRGALTRLSVPTLALLVLGSAGTGAALMYLLDPERGRRRRALARDKAALAVHHEREFLGKAARDLRKRSIGVVARAKHGIGHVRGDHPSDTVLLQRVRSALGHYVSHPNAIQVEAIDGEVILQGDVLAHEIGAVLRGIGRVRGVHRVIDHLERHTSTDHVPALQGESRKRPSMATRSQWSPGYRLLALGAGMAAMVDGLRRGGASGTVLATAGALVTVRAATNHSVASLFGIRGAARGIDIQKSIRVERPVSEVFEFWTHPENFPRFMGHVLDVTMDEDGEIWHWEVAGPAGTKIPFGAVVTDYERDRRYGWKTVEGAMVSHTGIVRFEEDGPDACRVHVRMTYMPPAGVVGHAVASLFRKDPKHALDDDLLRMKTLLETGKTSSRARRPATDQFH